MVTMKIWIIKSLSKNKESIHHTSLGECKFIILKTLSGDKKPQRQECSLCGNGTVFYYCCYYSVLLTKISFGGQFDNACQDTKLGQK